MGERVLRRGPTHTHMKRPGLTRSTDETSATAFCADAARAVARVRSVSSDDLENIPRGRSFFVDDGAALLSLSLSLSVTVTARATPAPAYRHAAYTRNRERGARRPPDATGERVF
jgi:hypothetical protein